VMPAAIIGISPGARKISKDARSNRPPLHMG
jgi:hypothetical protein